MRKIMIIALAMMAGASFSTADAKTKKMLKNAPVVERPKQTVMWRNRMLR